MFVCLLCVCVLRLCLLDEFVCGGHTIACIYCVGWLHLLPHQKCSGSTENGLTVSFYYKFTIDMLLRGNDILRMIRLTLKNKKPAQIRAEANGAQHNYRQRQQGGPGSILIIMISQHQHALCKDSRGPEFDPHDIGT